MHDAGRLIIQQFSSFRVVERDIGVSNRREIRRPKSTGVQYKRKRIRHEIKRVYRVVRETFAYPLQRH